MTPAMWMIRKLVRRVRAVAKAQFTGGTRLFETMQETVQGIRIVKAFTLEDRLRKRYYENVATVEYEANKMARMAWVIITKPGALYERCDPAIS